MSNGLPAIHPGEFLSDELQERSMTCADLDVAMNTPPGTAAHIIAGETDITPDLALRLDLAGIGAGRLWLQLQNTYNVKKELGR